MAAAERSLMLVAETRQQNNKREREVEVDAPTKGVAWCVLPSSQSELTLSPSLFVFIVRRINRDK
jgi:hypothetical protein